MTRTDKILLITIVVITLIMIAGIIAGIIQHSEIVEYETRFSIVAKSSISQSQSTIYLIVDNKTGVVYWEKKLGTREAISPLLNPDGSPVLYDFQTKELIESEQ